MNPVRSLAPDIVSGDVTAAWIYIAGPLIGAFIAGWLFPRLGFHIGGGIVAEIIYAAIGAILLLLIVRLIRTGGRF